MEIKLTITENGTRAYHDEDGQYHNDHGPAVIYPDGAKYWYNHGIIHRLDGPAAIFQDKSVHWYINGKCVSTKPTTLQEIYEKNPEYLI
jgi:hypothetical protein